MDQPARTTLPQTTSPLTAANSAAAGAATDPNALPVSTARRAQLLFILIILPVVAVSLPAIFVTAVFGPRPKVVVNTKGLHEALEQSANKLLPTPSALTTDAITLTCRPDQLAARAERLTKLAATLGGSANEFLGQPGEKHFFVDLPANKIAAFRGNVTSESGGFAFDTATLNSTPAAKEQLEVFIRANAHE